MTEPSPRAVYEDRLSRRRSAVADLQALDRKLSVARGIVFATGAVLWWLAVGPGVVGAAWVFGAIGLFAALMLAHEIVARALRKGAQAIDYVDKALARQRGEASGALDAGEAFRDAGHPYAEDLDLFGDGSLYARLCLARTGEGRRRLADWLREPSDAATLEARRQATEELRPRLDLREELWLLGADVAGEIHPDGLRRWTRAPAVPFAAWERPVAAIVTLALSASLVWWLGFGGPADPVLLALLAWVALWFRVRGRAEAVLAHVGRPAAEVALLTRLLRRVEREAFESPALRRLRECFDDADLTASAAVGRLQSVVDLLESRRNAMFAPFAALGFVELHGAAVVERWRHRHAAALPRWLDALAELEALCSLAGWAFDHPDHTFAEIVGEWRGLEAEGLGHPLLPEGSCVRNDVRLDPAQPLLVISGSNMSGKSTLLRAAGANVVLALAGAPVRARRLRVGAVRIGASIQVRDSLLEGRSRFYAEISRLRQVLDLTDGAAPVLFLLDELLAGTNSEDRRAGAESVVRELLSRGAFGMLTTHDLALTRLAETLDGLGRNAHFEDQVEGDRVVFDYRLRPGVVARGNALALMRAIGLMPGGG